MPFGATSPDDCRTLDHLQFVWLIESILIWNYKPSSNEFRGDEPHAVRTLSAREPYLVLVAPCYGNIVAKGYFIQNCTPASREQLR